MIADWRMWKVKDLDVVGLRERGRGGVFGRIGLFLHRSNELVMSLVLNKEELV